MKAEEFIEWESRKVDESDHLLDELAEVARNSPKAKQFSFVLMAALEQEKQKATKAFLTNHQEKADLLAFHKGIEAVKRLINKAIEE